MLLSFRSAVFFAFCCWVSQNAWADAPVISEWEVPYPESGPRDPFVDSKGRVWFCGQAGGYLAYLDPQSGDFTKYELEKGVGPHNLIIDAEDSVWFAANTKPFIGRLDPKSGEVTQFPMPDGAKDPHTLVFDSAGNIWFTSQWSNTIGKLQPNSGAVQLVQIPVARARPYGIKIDGTGRPWVVLFGTNRLATVNPNTMALELVELPRRQARPRRIEVTGDNMIWYGDYAEGILGRYDPQTKQISEWPLPGGADSRPYGTALDDRDRIWLAEGGTPNRLAGFDTKKEEFVSVAEIPNSKGSIRHMYFEPKSRSIWFGEDSNFLGRAQVP